MHLLMPQELSLDVEVLAAYRTVIRSRTTIFLVRSARNKEKSQFHHPETLKPQPPYSLLMLIEIILARKVLPADRTGKQLLPRVRHDVPHQVLLPAERFAAPGFVALERPKSDVRFEMLHQVFLSFERFRAHVAGREANGGGGRDCVFACRCARQSIVLAVLLQGQG